MLSSDILEEQFGPIHMEVLFQDERRRIIQMIARETGRVLEQSWVTFCEDGVREFPAIHASITAGQSMGRAFRQAGIRFVRETRTVSRLAVSPDFNERFGSREPATVVEVDILVGSQRTPYAQIVEVYNPVVDWPEPLQNPRSRLPQLVSPIH